MYIFIRRTLSQSSKNKEIEGNKLLKVQFVLIAIGSMIQVISQE